MVGCSGGPDSTALMVALSLLGERLGYTVQVVCVDHGLRPEAAEEARLVQQVALRLGLSARRMNVHVAKQASVQAAARTARYQALTKAARDFGSQAVDGKVHMHDLHATILHQLGLDHEKLTFKYAGRNFRLTDVHGRVVREVVG